MAVGEEPVAGARVLGALEKVLDEWFVTGIHRAGARKFIQEKICKETEECRRVRQWLLLRMNGRIWEHGIEMMCRSPDNVPNLRSMPIWPREDTPWLTTVEARHAEILAELMAVRKTSERSGFQPYRDPVHAGSEPRLAKDGLGVEGVDRGMWNVLYLFLNHKQFEENCVRFPKTIAAIQEAFPRHYSHAFFSALTPGSHIVKHFGPSNRMLRVWLPLCGFEQFKLRVGEKVIEPKEGEAFVWDHSYEHEAWHEGSETRLVLIVDIWHPDLTDAEVKFLRSLQSCRLRAGKVLAELTEREPEEATYFEIVEKARSLLTDDDWWVVKAQR